ncbi:MAG: hypothetical protein DI629_07295 [Mesorhizobium amorphae]|nr:MAG: hypothetical protein DI629_07295 [Mesorhizobium amorphae]
MTDADLLDQAFNQPFSPLRTLSDSFAQGVRESVVGTVVREGSLPEAAPTDPGIRIQMDDGSVRVAPDTPQLARRRTMFGNADTTRPETSFEFQQRRFEAGAMEQDAWAQSRYFRKGVPWDKGMTEDRAAALADSYDRRKLVEFYAQKRPITAFMGSLTAGFVDPINYVPIFGPAARGASVLRQAGKGAADAMASTALFGALTMDARNRLGDEVTIEGLAQEVAMSALVGSAFGTAAGGIDKAVEKRRLRGTPATIASVADRVSTLEAQREARIPLSEAVQQMAMGDRVQLGPNSEDVIARMGAKVGNVLDERARYAVTPTGTRIEVRPEVIDATQLVRASGDLQPRDRTRAASEAQIADIAANLDPDRLLPAPEADRGAPIVGPDNIVESGNGRVAAIRRAAELHPERFDAYKRALRDMGFDVPDQGVPILVSRRLSDLSDEQRVGFVNDSNSSAIARMSATEQALVDTRAMTDAVVSLHTGGDLASAGNRNFVSAFLRRLPENERANLMDASGALNADGARRAERALVAAAYGDADMVARMAESLDDNAKSITGALVDSAGKWARLRGRFDRREIAADVNMTGNILDALRTVSKAREDAAAQGRTVGRVLDEMLRQSDLLTGDFDPTTEALVRALFQGGDLKRAKSREKIAAYLDALADEIEAAGQPQLFGDVAEPRAIIQGAQRRVDGKGLFDGRSLDEAGTPAQGRRDGRAADGRQELRDGGRAAGQADRGTESGKPDDQPGRIASDRWHPASLQSRSNVIDLADAARAVGKPDTFKAMAEQFRVDPVTGSFAEEAEIAQLLAEGRVSDEDMRVLREAQETFDNATAYDQALQAAARCII